MAAAKAHPRWTTPETIARIVELRNAGKSITAVCKELGVSNKTVIKYQPKVDGMRRSSHHVPENQILIDDVWADEYADVVPIVFFPDDLPRLDMTDDGFNWTQAELADACEVARHWLFDNPQHLDGAA